MMNLLHILVWSILSTLFSLKTHTKDIALAIHTVHEANWQPLFNGQNLDNWIIKIAKHELNENYANTFRVEDGLLKVRYDGYEEFDQQFGHIHYKESYSMYVLRIEYRFVGEQAKGGEGWAWRNSGVMIHGQHPSSMLRDQDFPISIEAQLLGGDGTNHRTTGNLCTPGTFVVMKDQLFTPHCINSTSKTFHGDHWVTAEFVVLADSLIQHYIEGDLVLEYTQPQIGGGNVINYDESIKVDGKALKSGYISLQSESHPVDFRKVEILDLSPFASDPQKMAQAITNAIKKRPQ